MSCTTSYNDANFRLLFPAFKCVPSFSEAQLSANWTMGTSFIIGGCGWKCVQLQQAQDLMAAHLTYLMSQIKDGIPTGVVQSATEGTVSIGLVPPPATTAFGYWLSSSPYGMQLRALLLIVSSVGMYVGGSLERASFRKAGGRF